MLSLLYTSAELEKKISDMKKAVREGQEVNTEETPSPAVTVSTESDQPLSLFLSLDLSLSLSLYATLVHLYF